MKAKLVVGTDCYIPRWDGIARFLTEILPSISEDYDITIIAPDYKGDHSPLENVRIVRMPLSDMVYGDIQLSKVNTKLLKEIVSEADIVWTQTIGPIGYETAKIAKKLKKPFSVYVHSIDWQLAYRALSKKNILAFPIHNIARLRARKVYNWAQKVMVPSDEVKEILKWNKVNAPIEIVRMGVKTDEFIPAESKREAKELLGFSHTEKLITYVGRIGREKDILTLYRAFLDLQKKKENIRLLIVGEGLLSHKEKMHANNAVTIVGSQSNVLPYLQATDIFVMPSQIETTSLATLEAMSCELPVVCTPVGLMKEYIREKHNGIHFPVGNSLVLSLKLESLLDTPAQTDAMGFRARGTVQKLYSFDQTVSRVKSVLRQVLSK